MLIKLISDNNDTFIGLRLVGVDGVVVRNKADALNAYNDFSKDENVGLILITERINKMCEEFFTDKKLNSKKPLITVIPGDVSIEGGSSSIMKYVNEAIGIKL